MAILLFIVGNTCICVSIDFFSWSIMYQQSRMSTQHVRNMYDFIAQLFCSKRIIAIIGSSVVWVVCTHTNIGHAWHYHKVLNLHPWFLKIYIAPHPIPKLGWYWSCHDNRRKFRYNTTAAWKQAKVCCLKNYFGSDMSNIRDILGVRV